MIVDRESKRVILKNKNHVSFAKCADYTLKRHIRNVKVSYKYMAEIKPISPEQHQQIIKSRDTIINWVKEMYKILYK